MVQDVSGFLMNRMMIVRVALIMMVMLISVPSYAQSIDPDKIEGIPRFDELSDEEFNDNTLWIEESPKKNAYLAYKIRLPYDWERSELSQEKGGFADDSLTQDRSSDFVSRSILGLIAKYNGPSNFGVRSYIEVRAKELTRIISARNWFIHFVLTNGYSLEGMEMLSENRVEGLYVQIINDVSYAVRVICELNGNQVVLMSYYMPVSRIKDEKALQEKIVGSFHFIDPEKPEVALTRTYSFMGVVHFDYPYSLRLPAPKVYSFSEMELQLINAANNNKSSFTEIDIHIMAHDKVQSLAEEVLLLKQRMEKEKIKIGDMREVYKRYEVGENIDFHRVEVYNAEGMGKKIVPHEYWIAILRDSTYFYIISMLTTGRTSDFYTWAQNVEALGVIFKTIGKGPSPRMEKDKKAEAIAPPSSSSSVP